MMSSLQPSSESREFDVLGSRDGHPNLQKDDPRRGRRPGAAQGRASGRVPRSFDHVQLACNDLDKGIAFVESRTGVKAAFGVHPGRARGTLF